ncbi:MAG: WbqC family protein [Taibaiella sp.]|nr:WbqC family protein [Taibaiella sp.]
MQTIVSSLLPFPPVTWWASAIWAESILLDRAENFEKMSYRNKYRIAGSNNVVQLSVPLVKGRNQRQIMSGILIHNEEHWQVQHWRTLTSVYKRSPFWEFYETSLNVIFETEYTYLIDFNRATIDWVLRQLKVLPSIIEINEYKSDYGSDAFDLRSMKPAQESENYSAFPRYYQVFEDRIGFQPNMSILDLLFNMGPAAKAWLQQYREVLTN